MRQSTTTHVSEPLSHFVEEYLAHLYEMYPTAAAADGVHTHDDLLEDLSRAAIDARIRDLGGWARRLDGINPSALTPVESLERRMLGDRIRGHLFALEEIRDWERNPLHYADTLAASLAGQTLFAYAGLPERARRVGSKLRQVRRLLEAARRNVTEAPGLFVKVGIESLEGVLRFVERDLPRAFRDLEDMHLLGVLADTSMEASDALREHIAYLRDTLAPRSRASFRLGRARFEQLLRLDEGLGLPADHLLDIARRELHSTQDEFARVAAEMHSDPRAAWRRIKERHPAPDALFREADEQVESLRTFLTRKRIVSMPEQTAVQVLPTPDFYRRTVASLWSPGPFEPARMPAFYHVTNIDPVLARRAPAGASARPELRHPRLDHRARGLSRPFPASRAPARGLFLVPQVGVLRDDVVRRRLGPLRRADGPRRGLRARKRGAAARNNWPKPCSGSPEPSSASGCTPRTCRSSRGSDSSATRRTSRSRVRGRRPSAPRSTPAPCCTRSAS